MTKVNNGGDEWEKDGGVGEGNNDRNGDHYVIDHNHNTHLNFVKGTLLGDKEQVVGIRDKG